MLISCNFFDSRKNIWKVSFKIIYTHKKITVSNSKRILLLLLLILSFLKNKRKQESRQNQVFKQKYKKNVQSITLKKK